MTELFIDLDATSGETLQARIYRGIRAGVLHGRLHPGGRASSRELAAQLLLSRNTVILAYERLQSEGYLETPQRKWDLRRCRDTGVMSHGGRCGGRLLASARRSSGDRAG